MILVSAVVFCWMDFSHRLRLRRVRRLYHDLPREAIKRVLDRIDEAGRLNHACTILVADRCETAESATVPVDGSRYGGVPYAQAEDVWPVATAIADRTAEPFRFLIQVQLDDSCSSAWSGRLLTVFAHAGTEPLIRSYSTPFGDRYAALAGGPTPEQRWSLRRIRIPRSSGEEHFEGDADSLSVGLLNYDPVILLESIPEIRTDLNPFTTRPADLLAAVIAPNHCGYGFDLSDIVQMGGKPVWLNEVPGHIECDKCRQPMRFLFQFGDLNRGQSLGESGVCYVFGCDEHPEHPKAMVQHA